jgi:hypothetical protein
MLRRYAVWGRPPRFRCVKTVPEKGVDIRSERSGRVTEMAPSGPSDSGRPGRAVAPLEHAYSQAQA